MLDEYGDKYYDDVIENTLSGSYEVIYENQFLGNRTLVKYATPIINWYFVSQRLHLNQINNYKAIYGINVNVTGTNNIIAKLSTKIYREGYHPEKSGNDGS